MPTPRTTQARTLGSSSFEPDAFLDAWKNGTIGPPGDSHFREAIVKAFGLKENDDYVYHAIASVTLAQVQQAVNFGGQNGLHAWYVDDKGEQIPPPPSSDITAYTSIFSPTTSTSKALVAFAANAKKGSLRATIASHMQTHFLPPNTSTSITPSLSLPNKLKTPEPPNPYLEFWTWTCHNLEWAGPTPQTVHTHHSHPLLPILYHHFGCICPTHDALVLIRQLCQTTGSSSSRSVLEIGSGGGYWAYLLRQLGVTVTAVDNGVSEWRTRWIGDTVAADGVSYLQRNRGGRDAVLLLVYPQVGGDFTGKMLQAYAGDAVVVAGTQNANGFTGFKGETVAEWMEREMGKEGWKRAVQVPLPSFAGKDEALFVFVRDEKKGS